MRGWISSLALLAAAACNPGGDSADVAARRWNVTEYELAQTGDPDKNGNDVVNGQDAARPVTLMTVRMEGAYAEAQRYFNDPASCEKAKTEMLRALAARPALPDVASGKPAGDGKGTQDQHTRIVCKQI